MASVGGFFIISSSTGSTPRARAGRLSVTRFTQSSWIASRGVGSRMRKAASTVMISPILQDRRKWTVFLMFSKIPRPCRTAATMVEKLSSVRIISAAPLATSVPETPIAQPMSAALRAGASLMPSPVMATTAPRDWNALTIRTLCSGETRANTVYSKIWRLSSFWLIASSWAPVRERSLLRRIPSSLAMARAVTM